jgi:hypothetical protein
MPDMVYNYLHTAEDMCEATYQGLHRYTDTALEFRFRIDHTCYDEEGEDIGNGIRFAIRYHSKNGSNYVRVSWSPITRESMFEPKGWEELANHDSCWRGCWSEILAYARKKLIEEFHAKGSESWYFNCESVKAFIPEESKE